MRGMIRLPLIARVYLIVGFLISAFWIEVGLYLSDMIVLVLGICMLIIVLTFLYDINRVA